MENTEQKQVQLQVEEKKLMTARFAAMVEKESKDNAGVVLSEEQKEILQGYVDVINQVMMLHNDNITNKKEYNSNSNKQEELPELISWNNIDIKDLSRKCYLNSLLGLNSVVNGMIYFVPFYNKAKKTYNLNVMRGYNGSMYIAKHFAENEIDDIIVELVYANDEFTMIKKDADNEIESYKFKITNAFNRGDLVGAFGYIKYKDKKYNKIIEIPLRELDKIRSLSKSSMFWGKINDKGEEVGGFSTQMYLKSAINYITRPRFIPLNPKKMCRSAYLDLMLDNQEQTQDNEKEVITEEEILPQKETEAEQYIESEVVQEEKQEYIPEIEQVQQEVIQEEIPQTQPQPQRINRDDL